MGISPYHLGSGARLGLLLLVIFSMSFEVFAGTGSSVEYSLEPGSWGGHGAALQVLEAGAIIEFDCAFGRISEPITVQHSGRFSVPGKYLREPGGPLRLPQKKREGSPAVFSGEVTGSELLLRVELPDEGRSIGPFILNKSRQAELEKCL